MRVSPKYIIQLCQKGTKLHKSRTSIRKRQKKYCMYSRYTSCKRVPKKRTKKRQTQVKRQGSVVTSRIKLKSVVTSRIKLEIVEIGGLKLESVVTSRIKLEIVETSQIKLESVVTSRIKLEIVETSRIKLEINEAFSILD